MTDGKINLVGENDSTLPHNLYVIAADGNYLIDADGRRYLDGVSSLDQLNGQQKVDLANSLELIKATLLAQEGGRVICRIESKTGTHLTTRRCESVADRERNAAEAQKYMRDHPDHIQQEGH